jgi:3-methyl-2-oxobutanoate hydroxymethyltransferase
MVDAGCFSIMCEVTTEEVCQFLTEVLPVPVVSLGAGNKAHGVHIISSDLFHLYEEHTPRHSKIYTDLIPIIEDVYTRYMTDVRARTYPGPEHTAYMAPKELEQFAAKVGWSNPPIEAAEQREKSKRKPAQSAA